MDDPSTPNQPSPELCIAQEELFTVSDVARIYRVTPRTVFDWLSRGLLVPSIKIGCRTRRFTREDLAKLERSGN